MTKIPKEQQSNNDGYMALLVSLFVTTAIGCFVVIMGLMIFVSGLYHWWFIFVMPFALIISMLPAILTAVVARVCQLKNKGLHRLMIGVVYGVLSIGAFVFAVSDKLSKQQIIGYGFGILLFCTIIGFISARVLPDE